MAMLNKWHVYNGLIEHYKMTGQVMGPDEFQERFAGQVQPEQAVDGLHEFDKFLDASRGAVQVPHA